MTGPSGAGKGTLITALLARRNDLEVAVSATTRPRRPGEVDGREYYFLTDEEFQRRAKEGEFLEWVEYVADRYGTLRSEVERIFSEGRNCVLELETQGALAVKEQVPDAVTIFVTAPLVELERRLRERATESAGEIHDRLAVSRRQLEQAGEFDYVVENEALDRAVTDLAAIVDRETVGTLKST